MSSVNVTGEYNELKTFEKWPNIIGRMWRNGSVDVMSETSVVLQSYD